MKTKKERTAVIKRLFEELRKEIVVKHELHLMMLRNYEDMENRAITENSDIAVKRIKKYVAERKKRVYELKSVGKKYIVEKGEIVKVIPLK